jgi:hypothetical protein
MTSINQDRVACNPSLEEQSDLWSSYCVALQLAQRTRHADDIAKARRAWFAFLPAYLPNPDERGTIPAPGFSPHRR